MRASVTYLRSSSVIRVSSIGHCIEERRLLVGVVGHTVELAALDLDPAADDHTVEFAALELDPGRRRRASGFPSGPLRGHALPLREAHARRQISHLAALSLRKFTNLDVAGLDQVADLFRAILRELVVAPPTSRHLLARAVPVRAGPPARCSHRPSRASSPGRRGSRGAGACAC